MVRFLRQLNPLARPCAGLVPDIPQSLRALGVGYSRLLQIGPSEKSHRRNCVRVRPDFVIPANYPLAIVPCSAVVSVSSLHDKDKVHSMPLLDDVRKMLPEGFVGLAEPVSLALFLAFQAGYKRHAALPLSRWSETQIDLAAKAPTNPDAAALLDEMEEAVAAFHRKFSAMCNAPRLVLLLRAWRYVLSARCELSDPTTFEPSANDEGCPSEPFHLSILPLVDLMVARTGPQNVSLFISSAKKLKSLDRDECRDEACDFFGSWQKLLLAPPNSRYFTIVSSTDLRGGDELCLEPLPTESSRSLFDEIRGGF
jgi:hypothetical protein